MANINVYLVSLGCDKNRVDGETMVGTLRHAGYTVINEPENAQVIIVNTCGFIKDAVQESIDLILELSEYKNMNCRKLIVVGCMAQRYKKEIAESIPEADVIIGVGEYENIAQVVEGLVGAPNLAARQGPGVASRIAARTDDITPHIAYVKIAEGCDNHCTYCTIPSIRGPYKSQTMDYIMEESRQLVAAGAREIVLVAQDTTLYGTDIYGKKMLPELLRQLANIDGLTWVRLMYAYPEHIDAELINAMAELPQVCKYIDMPIQHSEDIILRGMGRGGSSKAKIKETIAVLRQKMPGISIRTTLIVGFPGETSKIFDRLLSFVREVKFDRLGVFPYSREEGTAAALLAKQVHASTKQKRLEQVMEAQQVIHFAKNRTMVGQTVQVMVDSYAQETNECTGRTQCDAYEVDTVVTFSPDSLNDELALGNIYSVKITDTDQYDLKGEI